MLLSLTDLVSDAQRNLNTIHVDTRIFLRYCLSRHFGADAGSVYRGLKPQVDSMRATT
jgi:hypothetical protein